MGKLHRKYAPATLNMMLELKGLYVKIGQVTLNKLRGGGMLIFEKRG